MLRLYTEGRENPLGLVGIIPRLGRAVLFKSEEMLHKVMPSHDWDNYALTFYFTQIIDKTTKPHPVPDDWKIFISIASYRDLELYKTMKSLIYQAVYPERLRIVVYNQQDFWHEWDKEQDYKLDQLIKEAQNLPYPPSILVENIWHEDAKNVYFAR